MGIADVARVGRAVAGLGILRIDGEADPRQVPLEQSGHRGVRLERIVDRRVDGDLDAAPRGRRRALGRRLEAAPDLLEVPLVQRPQVEVRGGVLRDDVRLLAADGDDTVHARVGAEMLAHGVERVEEPHTAVREAGAMRTTIEIKPEHRAKLLELAARRGAKGFSELVDEARGGVARGDDPGHAGGRLPRRGEAPLRRRGLLRPRAAGRAPG